MVAEKYDTSNDCVRAVMKVFPTRLWGMALAISQAESGRQSWKIGYNQNGTLDRGCMQINSIHVQYDPASLMNAEYNAEAALQIYQTSGWYPWTTFRTGAYLKYLK